MADVEALLIPWLAAQLDVRVLTDLPADLQDILPVVQVVRVGGPRDDNNPRFDLPTIAVDCFAADRAAASTLAERTHDALRVSLPGLTLAGSTVTRVETITSPAWRPYDDTAMRRLGALYRMHIKHRS